MAEITRREMFGRLGALPVAALAVGACVPQVVPGKALRANREDTRHPQEMYQGHPLVWQSDLDREPGRWRVVRVEERRT